MASNADLIAAAQMLGQKLDEEVETTGLKNAELVALVSGLRARADEVDRTATSAQTTAGLVAQANVLAEQLETTVETGVKSDEELQNLIDGMKVGVDEKAKADASAEEAKSAAKGADENETAKSDTVKRADDIKAAKADLAADIAAEDAANVADNRPPYYVMPGKAITTKRGILGPDQEITAADLTPKDLKMGLVILEKFVQSGHVGKA